MDTVAGFWAGAIALANRRDLGPERAPLTMHQLAQRCGGWERMAGMSLDQLVGRGLASEAARQLVVPTPLHTMGTAFTLVHPEYPTALTAWAPGGPPVLFVEGTLAALRRPSVAIVGTRACSPYGASVAHRIAWSCARAGLTVLSGLARGIDSHAHLGSLAGGGLTAAVLGHGLMHTAPVANRGLRRRIVENGGAMISTWPDPVPPSKRSFPERNQWIAALARVVVVVEAPERSGALHTAYALMEQPDGEQRVWVVPGPFGAQGWEGSLRLIELGARPLLRIEDLLDSLDAEVPDALRHPDWLAAVLAGTDLGEASRMAGMSAVDVLRELTRLELAGRVVRLPGGRYAPAGGGP